MKTFRRKKKSRPKIIRKESKKEKDTLGAGPAD